MENAHLISDLLRNYQFIFGMLRCQMQIRDLMLLFVLFRNACYHADLYKT